MRIGHSLLLLLLLLLSFSGLIFSVISSSAKKNSHIRPTTHRRIGNESAGKRWIPPDIRESWTIMDTVLQITTNDSNPSLPTIPSKNAEQNIADESRPSPNRRIVVDPDPYPYPYPVVSLLSETDDPTHSSTLLQNQLRNRSCEAEVSMFGYDREIGASAHEIFCETDKLLRYAWIAARNLIYEFGIDQLFDEENQEKRISSLKRRLSDKNLLEIVEYYLTRFREFLTNPEYLEYFSIVVENSVPVAEMREGCGRLEIAIDNLMDRVAKMVESRLDLAVGTDTDDANPPRKEIVDALRFVRERLSNRIEGTKLPQTGSSVESLFDQFHDRESFSRYFAVSKKLTDTLQDVYRGYRASGFQKHIIAPTTDFMSTFLTNVRQIPSADRILSDDRSVRLQKFFIEFRRFWSNL